VTPPRWRRLRRSLRLALARRRRLAVGGCLAAAVGAAVHALAPAPPVTVPVWVAARDLPAGRLLAPDDVTTGAWPPSARPDGLVADPRGTVLAGPLRRGEPVTDARLLGAGLLTGQEPGVVAVTVRLGDPGGVVGVRPGERVDVLAGAVAPAIAPAAGDGLPVAAETVAAAALVLAVPGAGDTGAGGSGGWAALDQGITGGAGPPPAADAGSSAAGLLVLAVDASTASRLAAVASLRLLSVAVHDG